MNEVAPVRALVADDGQHVVTFDNWHMLGHGENVVVIYGEDGRLIRSLTLTDFLPQFWIDALPHTVSSIHWGGDHVLSGPEVVLKVVVPTSSADARDAVFVDVSIDLATGQVVEPSNPEWEAALAQARSAFATQRAAESARDRAFRAPLYGPVDGGEREWHRYLIEAFFRADPDWRETYPATKVLRLPSASNYAASERWLSDALKDVRGQRVVMIASLSEANLVGVLQRIGPSLGPGSLRDMRVYVAASEAVWPDIERALAASGAQVIRLDPTVGIAQRPERLRN